MSSRNLKIIFTIILIATLITFSGCIGKRRQNNTNSSIDLPDIPNLSPGMHELSLEMIDYKNIYNSGEKVTRDYLVHIPEGFNPNKEYDLLLFFHGTTGTSMKSYLNTGFKELADEEGFIAVFPQGMGISEGIDNRFVGDDEPGNKNTCWNSRPDGGPGDWCYSTRRLTDDDKFIDKIIGSFNKDYNIKRIFSTGFSNGCGYAQHVALSRDDIDGAGIGGCKLPGTDLIKYDEDVQNNVKEPFPILRFHGTDDTVSEYVYLGEEPTDGPIPTAESAADLYAEANGCSKPAVIEENIPHSNSNVGQVDHWAYPNCDADVEFYKIGEGTHKWYREMTPIIWDFLDEKG